MSALRFDTRALALGLTMIAGAAAADTVLVTALQGTVSVEAKELGKTTLEPFVRLREGDRLTIPAGGKISLVYVTRARLENWQGAGVVVVGDAESRAAGGKPQLAAKSLPPETARQMNRTPSATPDGRAGMMRMRGLPSNDAVARLEGDYRQMRSQTTADDILPEVFLLAGLFDLRQYARIEEELKRIDTDFAGNPTARSLQELYAKAIAGARAPAGGETQK